jgi:hypothetical protein
VLTVTSSAAKTTVWSAFGSRAVTLTLSSRGPENPTGATSDKPFNSCSASSHRPPPAVLPAVSRAPWGTPSMVIAMLS